MDTFDLVMSIMIVALMFLCGGMSFAVMIFQNIRYKQMEKDGESFSAVGNTAMFVGIVLSAIEIAIAAYYILLIVKESNSMPCPVVAVAYMPLWACSSNALIGDKSISSTFSRLRYDDFDYVIKDGTSLKFYKKNGKKKDLFIWIGHRKVEEQLREKAPQLFDNKVTQ